MFQTNPVLLNNLLNQVGNGDIQLPDFQRGWVWDDDRIKGLLTSISRGFPIGAVMTLSAGGEIRLKARPIEGVDEKRAASPSTFLLDGQQRLTSLYQSLRHPGPVDTHDNRKKRIQRWYYIDMKAATDPDADPEDAVISVPENRRTTRDFGREITLNLSTREMEYKEHKIPTEQLMGPMKWMMGYVTYWKEVDPNWDAMEFFDHFNDAVVTKFTEYQLPVISLGKQTPKEAVCAVFEKVNTGGVVLNVFELATASFAADAEHFSLRDDWEERKKRLYNRPGGVLQGVDGNQFLQAIALLKTQQDRRAAISDGKTGQQVPAIGCRRRDILNLNLNDYQHWADRAEQGFVDAAEFLVSHQYVYGSRNVPYGTQLVPLAVLYVELGRELDPGNAKAKLEQWYWSGVFGEAYGGTVETQFALDLAEVAEWIRGGPRPRLMDEASFAPERLLSLRTRNSAAYKGLYALQMKNGAADWRTNQQLSWMTFAGNGNIDIHHVFPRSWCESTASPRIPSRLYNAVINKTPIDAVTNKIIGGRAPSVYLPRLEQDISSEWLDGVLKSHWLDPSLLYADDFAQSFVARGEKMLALIGQAMGRDLGSGREVFLNALHDAGVSEDEFDEEPEYNEYGEAA